MLYVCMIMVVLAIGVGIRAYMGLDKAQNYDILSNADVVYPSVTGLHWAAIDELPLSLHGLQVGVGPVKKFPAAPKQDGTYVLVNEFDHPVGYWGGSVRTPYTTKVVGGVDTGAEKGYRLAWNTLPVGEMVPPVDIDYSVTLVDCDRDCGLVVTQYL